MAKQLVLIFCVLVYVQLIHKIGAEKNMEHLFRENEIIPDVIQEAPKEILKVTYKNGLKVNNGNELTPTQVKEQPEVEWEANDSDYYTLIMTDPDAPSRANPKFREFRHWLVANIPGNKIDEGEVVAAYVGSGPPQGTGLHRYIFLLYKQSGKLDIKEPRVANTSRRNRPNFRAAQFAKNYNLGAPFAGNFYQAQYDDYVPLIHKQLSEDN